METKLIKLFRRRVVIALLFPLFSMTHYAKSQVEFPLYLNVEEIYFGNYAFDIKHTTQHGFGESTDLFFRIYQKIDDTLMINDKGVLMYQLGDTLRLESIQFLDLYYRNRDGYYDTVLMTEKNISGFIGYLIRNLRTFHMVSEKQDFPISNYNYSSTELIEDTEIQVSSHFSGYRVDSNQRIYGKMYQLDVFSGDTIYSSFEISGTKISNDSFDQVFQLGMNTVRELNSQGLKPIPTPVDEADTIIPAITLNEDWLKRIESQNISNTPLSDFSNGKTKVFFFTYNGCVPCMMAKPYIKNAIQNDSLEIIIVNGVDRDSAEIMHRIERDTLTNIPVIMADKELMTDFRVRPHPTLLVFDSKGNQLIREEGFSEEFYKRFFGE